MKKSNKVIYKAEREKIAKRKFKEFEKEDTKNPIILDKEMNEYMEDHYKKLIKKKKS